MEKQETIGSVKLNLTWYGGQDLYSDGDAVENHILDIVKDEHGWDYCHKDYESWPVLYHLTRQRENICLPMVLNKDDEVLEIGAGMGAVTGGVAPYVKKVDCIELSYRRSLVNAYRHRGMDNIEIFVGNFKDIEIGKKYDVVTLIGVLEYACYYVGGDHPYEDFLTKIAGSLKEGGRLYIAIENKLGMKYFSGYHEDHLSRPFVGIEGYKAGDHVRTFTKSELTDLLKRTGYSVEEYYYPFPDYKLPTMLLSDDNIKTADIDYAEFHNYDLDVMHLFSQMKAFEGLKGTDERAAFANSFLVCAVKGEKQGISSGKTYIKCSDERTRQYAITTTIAKENGGLSVVKEAVYPQGQAHLERVASYAPLIEKAYAPVKACPVTYTEDGKLVFEFIEGESLEKKLKDAVRKGDAAAVMELILMQKELLAKNEDNRTDFAATPEFEAWFGSGAPYEGQKGFKVSNFDGTAGNIIFRGDEIFFIDYEWVFDFPMPEELVLYHCIRDAWYHVEGLEELVPLTEAVKLLGIRTGRDVLQKSYEAFFGHVVSDEKGESFAIAKHSALKKHFGARGGAAAEGTAEEAWRESGEAIRVLNGKVDSLNRALAAEKQRYAELDDAWFRRWDELKNGLQAKYDHLSESYRLMEEDRDIWKRNFENVTNAKSYKAMEKMRKVLHK